MDISKQEKKWQTEEDARTLARYEEIMSDTKRKNAAIKEAKKQASDLTKRAALMNNAANRKKK